MLKRDNYIVIQGWMVNELNLKGNELIVYALIYGFSQADNQYCEASITYITEWLRSSRQGAINVIKSLLEKEYIYREPYEEKGNLRYKYYHNSEVVKNFDQSKNLTGVVKKVDYEVVKKVDGGSQKSLPNNYIDKDINKYINKDIANPEKKHKYGEYKNVLLSDEELKKLQDEFADWKERIERVSSYCASSGKNYKNYLATIRNWARKENPRKEQSGSFSTNEFLALAKGR